LKLKENKLTIERTAHYYTLGADIANAKHLWIVFHGYGQLASRIIKKFDGIDLENNFIIAPEGLSKFYFKRSPEILGASWMTKHNRLDEIEDYINYIDKIYTNLIVPHTATLNVLGFSQGSSTMMRWINHTRPSLQKLIIWAGEFPPDINYENFKSYCGSIQEKYYCIGDEDEFINEKLRIKTQQFIDSFDLDFDIKVFDGKHEIKRPLLYEIAGSMPV